jgi:hypothetical protein
MYSRLHNQVVQVKAGTRSGITTLLSLVLVLFCAGVRAESIYQTPEEFLVQVFAGDVPENRALWLTDEIKTEARAILGRDLTGLRIRFWQHGVRSAWILDEIGKDKPITTGIVVNSTAIETVQVLVFRESRGWEVKHAFFTDQFMGARARHDNELDRDIDGITGATLSVQALKKQAQLALLLARHAGAAAD